MTTLEKIESKIGTIRDYDGRFTVWAASGVWDVRDALPKGVSLSLAQDALIEWDAEASKARKAAIKAAKEAKEEAQ